MRPPLIAVFLGIFVSVALAQMSPDEAQRRLDERQAARSASTQPDPQELNDLRAIIAQLRAENTRLKAQVNELNRKAPQTPQVGWNMVRLKNVPWASLVDTNQYDDVEPDGTLKTGRQGTRINVADAGLGGIQGELRQGNSAYGQQQVTGVHAVNNDPVFLPQWHLLKLTINNGSANSAQAFDHFDVYVDVDRDRIARLGKSDDK